ncbi:MAG TPA: amino acid adenylation domain-containing protein, partial [Longimicrobiaceae bacterium]|nr:amino acid adenylation domain-containing protein [Longimicrobiaceae bacterium]
PVHTRRGATALRVVPRHDADDLRALARGEGVTLYMALLAAFDVLLSRYSGVEDVLVGTPVAGRNRRELEGLIGFFVNTLVLRTDLSGNPPFRGLLLRVRETVLGAHAHQELPFERLVEELGVERSLAHTPVFQVMFSLEDVPAVLPDLMGAEVEELRPEAEVSEFDLALRVRERPEGFHLLLQYRTDLFDASTAERILEGYELLLAGAAGDAERRILDLPLLRREEADRLLHGWSAGPDPSAAGLPVHREVAVQAERTPDAPAVEFEGRTLTYAELAAAANRLASYLRRRGVGPETRVGVCLERSPDLVVAVLGVLGAGGAYVPLDPSYPSERLGYLVADSGVRLLVTEERVRERIPAGGVDVVRVDAERVRIAAESAEAPADGVHPETLAYVIYTSGSTGRPKGVRVQHGSLSNLVAASRETFGIGAGDVVLALASYAFDIWAFETLLPLTSGATVRLVRRERVLEVDELVGELEGATTLHAVPALMRQLAAAVRGTPEGAQRGLRRAFVGGDAVPPDLLAEMREAFPGAEVHVLYGPTEGTVLAASHRADDGTVARPMLGRSLAGVRLYVLDGVEGPVPVGVPGELYIGGAGVARDYLDRPALTAGSFVPDPFSGVPGARLYRTGDRVRWLPDGSLEFLGRLDHQVKIRGFRIEPGEVEAALARVPGVRESVVVAREDVPGDPRLVAYVVAEPGAGDPLPGLRQALRAELPEYMVPGAFVALDALPVTPNGKVDLRALPAPDGLHGGAREYVAPRTALEEVLAAMWAEVIGVERVGMRDNFFEVGGHSLLAARVVARIRVLKVEVPVRALFEAPTVEELAQYITKQEPVPGRTEMIAGILRKVHGMSAEERAALRGRQDAGATP